MGLQFMAESQTTGAIALKWPNPIISMKREKLQRSKYYRSQFSRYRNLLSFSNTELLSAFSPSPFSNKTNIFTALKEEHRKQMSYMCVSLRNSQGSHERSAHEAAPCWLPTWVQAGPVEPSGAALFSLRPSPGAPPLCHSPPRTAGPGFSKTDSFTDQERFFPQSGSQSSCSSFRYSSIFIKIYIH